MSATPQSALQRVVSKRLRVVQRDFLTRRGGRVNVIRSATAVGYCPQLPEASRSSRIIDAEVVHGDEQAFWTARRDFYRGGATRCFYPSWDRQAHALILLTREVPRVPQEAAFRLFAFGLKMMLMPRVVAGTELMLPAWLSMNAEGLLAEAGLDKGKDDASADAATATKADSSNSGDGNTSKDKDEGTKA